MTRSTGSLTGDLGATITDDGTATLPLATLHGDNVTNITIPAAQTENTPCTTIGAWSDYTEYGTPRDAAATGVVAGSAGYGWLGAKERSTTTESAGLTLMGDRLYNAATGLFTSMDPEPGGRTTAYAYPTDPINLFDLNGHYWWGQTAWRSLRTVFHYTPTRFLWFAKGHRHWTMSNGRPAFHWGNHQNRLEWDRGNGWHLNRGKAHYRLRDGIHRVRSWGGAAARWAGRGLGILAGVATLPWSCWVPPISINRAQRTQWA